MSAETKGFSLLELIVVMSILLIVAGVSLNYAGNSYSGEQLRATEIEMRSALTEARKQAEQGFLDQDHGVYINTSNRTFISYTGGTYTSREVEHDFTQQWSQSLSLIQPAGPTYDVNFAKLTGTTTPVTLEMQSDDGKNFMISINSLGIIQ